jgi:hypothetical protein
LFFIVIILNSGSCIFPQDKSTELNSESKPLRQKETELNEKENRLKEMEKKLEQEKENK